MAAVHEVLAYAADATELKAIPITDHDCITGSMQASRQARSFGIEVIIGEEISTQHGHLLGLFLERHIAAHRPVWETIADIHAQGGLAISPHLFDNSVPSIGAYAVAAYLGELGLDGVEGFNAGVYWPLRKCNVFARRYATAYQLATIGGSDSHSLPTIGKGYTEFVGNSAQDVYNAIKTRTVNCGADIGPLQIMVLPTLTGNMSFRTK